MKRLFSLLGVAVLLMSCPVMASAQTADEIIEKHLTAIGGRAALGKLTTRVVNATITVSTPIGDLRGTAEVYSKAPNKSRTFARIDGSAFGIPEITNDQRFDGVTGYVIDPLQGNREIGGDSLEILRNQMVPSPLLDYRDRGTNVALTGRERVGENEAYVVVLTPKTGPAIRVFIDAQTGMLVKSTAKVSIPEAGGDVEQVIEYSDFREVDGIKLPFATRTSNQAQTVIGAAKEIKHNVEIDDSSFARPSDK